ncbi:Pre-mRNA-splicing factor cwc21 [Penicillium hetheringtonii]|nr:Pre-mRNA-splicing factor cwc21 [Penicillium hetheringtonii]
MKPRNAGYGAPYPPTSARETGGFKQRVPDKKILEHDRMRAIEVKVLEERERLEEENERIEEEQAKAKGKSKGKAEVKDGEKEEGETGVEEGERVLSEEEIDERCEELRKKLLALDEAGSGSGSGGAGGNGGAGGKGRRNLKSYQVHELAEAKIEESERLRRALGIKEDGETGEISSWEKRR